MAGGYPGIAARSQLEVLMKKRSWAGSSDVVVLWAPDGALSIPRPATHWWNEPVGPCGPLGCLISRKLILSYGQDLRPVAPCGPPGARVEESEEQHIAVKCSYFPRSPISPGLPSARDMGSQRTEDKGKSATAGQAPALRICFFWPLKHEGL